MQIKTVMRTRFATVRDDLPLSGARHALARERVPTMPVVRGDTLVGLLHEDDIARESPSIVPTLAVNDWLADLGDLTVGRVMRAVPETLAPDGRVADAARLLRLSGLDAAPVLDGDVLVGIVTAGDLLELLEPRRPAAFTHVLVAVDLGPASEAVVTAGIELARQHEARLTLLHVVSPVTRRQVSEGLPAEMLERVAYRHREDCLGRLARLAPSDATLEVARLVQAGDPVTVLVTTALRVDADLIVLGDRRRRGLARLLGSGLTEAVIARAPCPVLVVRGDVACRVRVGNAGR